MPCYDYKCECGTVKEVVLSMDSVTPTIPCRCGREAERVFSVPRLAIHSWKMEPWEMDGDKEAEIQGWDEGC